jgi:hypothetical protein
MGLHLAFQDVVGAIRRLGCCWAVSGFRRGRQAGSHQGLRGFSMVGRAKAIIERSVVAAGRSFGMRPVEELMPVSL